MIYSATEAHQGRRGLTRMRDFPGVGEGKGAILSGRNHKKTEELRQFRSGHAFLMSMILFPLALLKIPHTSLTLSCLY